MFILYGILLALPIGLVLGGRLDALGRLQFRAAPLIVAGLLAQVLLFSTPLTGVIGWWGVPIYVGSTSLVLIGLAMNRRLPGITVMVAGATCNLIAIASNGGYMPADPGALVAVGIHVPADAYSNSAILASPAFPFLTDIFAMPRWIPFANVFSVGDVLIMVGAAIVVVGGMRARPAAVPATARVDAAAPAGPTVPAAMQARTATLGRLLGIVGMAPIVPSTTAHLRG